MGVNAVRVSLPLLWTSPSTSNIYKINESPYCFTAAPKYSPNNISERHADNSQVSTGIDLSTRHCDLAPAESRICTELKEVSSGTILKNRIFGNCYRLNKNGNLIASGEACKINVTMRTSSREQRDYHHGPNKVNRETRINWPSNTASTTSSSILATFANPGIKTFEMLSCQSTFRQGCKARTFLVNRKFKALQWKVPYFASNRLMHINGCINQGLGGRMLRDINRWTMVTGGTES